MKTNATAISRFLAVSAMALALPLSAIADGRDNNRCERDDNSRPTMAMRHKSGMLGLRDIDLTAEQVGALSKQRDDSRQLFVGKIQALRDQHDALRKLTMSDSYSKDTAAQIVEKIAVAQSEMELLHAEQGNLLYKILTPEQRTRLAQNELMDSSMHRGHKR
jgi:Spy/CpxP family protein refolding chaperone